jgi:hypothetical protein
LGSQGEWLSALLFESAETAQKADFLPQAQFITETPVERGRTVQVFLYEWIPRIDEPQA